MSRRLWCADVHLNHGNICIYCNRPWLHPEDINPYTNKFLTPELALDTAERMNIGLRKEINMKVKPEDTVIHVGDFMTRGKARGVEGLRTHWHEEIKKLNGTWVLLRGNHDDQNNIKTIGTWMICNVGPYMAFVSHWPTMDTRYNPPALIKYVKDNCDFAICGHVHDKWRVQWDDKLLNINVGVDVHKFRPIGDDEIIGIFESEKREYNTIHSTIPTG